MTRVSVEPAASLPIQPPRNKSARDDAAPPRDDFSAMVDDTRPPAAEPARTKPGDWTDRPQAADDKRRDDVAPAKADDARADRDTSRTAEAGTATAADPAKPESVKTDNPKPDADASTADPAAPDAPAVTAAIAVPQIVPQTPVAPVVAAAPATATDAGPLSIAAAALAATAATVQATTAAPAQTATASPAKPDAAAVTDPALAALAASASLAPKPAKSPAQALDATTAKATAPETVAADAAQPAAPAPQAAKTDAQPAAKPDGTPADIVPAPTPHERHAAAPQTSVTDISAQTFTPPQPAAPTATTLATAVPQISVVASQTAPVPLNGLAMQIAATAISGNTRFEIRLDPAELGRIDVRLDVDRHGNVTSHLTVEKPETLAMLRQDAPQLQRALNDAGLQTSDKGLQFSLSDQSLTGQNNNPNGNADDNRRAMQRLVIADDDNLSIASAGRSYGRVLASGSGVDIRI